MFGYVLPVKPEMKVREFDAYRASYCGVCKQLGKRYGVFSRFLLNYDLVLVAVMADALSGEVGTVRHEGCFANPLMPQNTLHDTAGLNLAADGLIMLSWHKLRDNMQDERWPKRMLYRLVAPFIHHMHRKAAARHPGIAAVLEEQMANQQALEARRSTSIDEACEPTAKMCEAIFRCAGQTPQQQGILARLGLFAGQIVYLLDAAEDFDEDMAQGRYNVFVQAGLAHTEAVQIAQRRCRMAAGEIALCYNLLAPLQYKEILDNIFFLGLPRGIALAGQKRTKRSPQHGQIESV